MPGELSTQRQSESPPDSVRDLTMPADFRLVSGARAMIHSTCLQVGLDEAAIWDLKVAATEALANAIEHGWASDGLIHMRLAPEGGKLLLEVSGGGSSKRTSSNGGSQRGRGFAIMSALMDEVSMRHDGETTVVRLAKRLTPVPRAPETNHPG